MQSQQQFDAAAFFRYLTEHNRLARGLGFAFGQCSGLDGLIDALAAAGSSPNFISVDDTSDGYTSLHISPSQTTVKTIYLTMRHKAGDMKARQYCIRQMREIFRQFMSALLPEKIRLAEGNIEIDPRIQFSEIDEGFFTGAACAYFQIAIHTPQNLCYNADEWE